MDGLFCLHNLARLYQVRRLKPLPRYRRATAEPKFIWVRHGSSTTFGTGLILTLTTNHKIGKIRSNYLFICLLICSFRAPKFVLPSRGRRKMWGVWEKNQHQRLRILHSGRFWRSVGCERDSKLELSWQKVSWKRGPRTATTWPGKANTVSLQYETK